HAASDQIGSLTAPALPLKNSGSLSEQTVPPLYIEDAQLDGFIITGTLMIADWAYLGRRPSASSAKPPSGSV
ncbi:hypothetical protein, partial [Cupriavidus sp. UYPR2.512]|uniref:hypothetical protein n=1 Tax=Cupriavidus sp. UYPR2.512 TaxID=1080187 RepID=UPI001E5175EA